MLKHILLLIFFIPFTQVYSQWSLDLTAGFAFQGYNDVRIPSETGTKFDFNKDFEIEGPVIPVSLRAGYNFAEKNHLFLLYAPLTINYEGPAPYDINFQNTVFSEGSYIEGLYKFNSYRLTYRRDLLLTERWTLGVGFTAKIRDARIKLSTDDLSDKKDDLGFVPLLNIFAAYNINGLTAYFEGDGLAGGPGRAFDFSAGCKVPLTDYLTVKGAYRFLEGGADVEEVYNFTLINVANIGLILNF